jgi:hypothetical protein
MQADKVQKAKHTPRHATGFIERLEAVFSAAGIRQREYVAVIMQATGLSKSGARLVIEHQRPPKQLEGFLKLVSYLVKTLQTKEIKVEESALSDYLLLDSTNPLSRDKDVYSLSQFYEKDAILTSEIIILIEKLAKEQYPHMTFEEKKMRLIYSRMLSYTFKNNMESDSDIVKKYILDLLSLANENLI